MNRPCMLSRILLACAAGLLAALAAGPVRAQGSGGAGILPFFLEPMDATRAALGGTGSARGGDAMALFANPAGVVGAPAEGAMDHTEFDAGLRLESMGLALPLDGGARGAFFLGAGYAHLGELESRDEEGNVMAGGVSYSAAMVRAGYGRELGRFLSLGAALEYLSQGVAGSTGAGMAAAFGLLARTMSADFSLAADHLGSSLHVDGWSQPLPRALRAGARLHAVRNLEVLAEWTRASGVTAGAAGIEYRLAGLLSLRGGLRRDLTGVDPVLGFSGGVGISRGTWSADYGLTQAGGSGLSAVHRFGLRIGLGHPQAGH